jgi:hypothetical protein
MTPKSAVAVAWFTLVAAALMGCAHAPRVGHSPYEASSQNGKGLGYSELQLNERTLQVTFAAGSSADARTGALHRAAEVALRWGADGFVVTNGEEYLDPVVRARFVVGRVKRDQPVTVLTIRLLTRAEFATVPPGTMVYDARLLAPDSGGRWPGRAAQPAFGPVTY